MIASISQRFGAIFRCSGTDNLSQLYAERIRLLSADAVVVQVGANDGKSFDPLYPHLTQNSTWTAYLIEPHPVAFSALEETYQNRPHTHLLRTAIDPKHSQVELLYVDRDEAQRLSLPDWTKGINSIYNCRNALGGKGCDKDLTEKIRQATRTTTVPAVRLDAFAEANSIASIDWLQIDTEGHDYKVLLSMGRIRPKTIVLEHYNLPIGDKIRLMMTLRLSRYRVWLDHKDLLCTLDESK